MVWLLRRNDGVSMLAASAILTMAVMASVWDEMGYILFLPPSLIAPLGLFIACFLWAWTMMSKGYLRSTSPAVSIAVTIFVGPILALAVYHLSRSDLIPYPKTAVLLALASVFFSAFLIPNKRTD